MLDFYLLVLCCLCPLPRTAERKFCEGKAFPCFFSLLNLWHLPYSLLWNRHLINTCEINEWKALLNKSVIITSQGIDLVMQKEGKALLTFTSIRSLCHTGIIK